MSFNDDTPPIADLHTPANVLVTGASSGIGLAILQQLLANRHVERVFAVSRAASTNDVLATLQREYGERLLPIDADLTDEGDLQRLSTTVFAQAGSLHMVVNAAGMLHAADMQPEKSLEQITKANLERVFAINAFAPILLGKSLMPMLSHGKPAVFASLSARVGSIGDNRSGGWYAYRGSKAAQNQLMKTFAIELARRNRNACCLLLHPGTVDTPLSTPFQARIPAEKLFPAARAASQLLDVMARSKPTDNGRFIAWDGNDVPW